MCAWAKTASICGNPAGRNIYYYVIITLQRQRADEIVLPYGFRADMYTTLYYYILTSVIMHTCALSSRQIVEPMCMQIKYDP